MALALRTKVLLIAALGITAYVVFVQDGSDLVQVTKAPGHPSASGTKMPASKTGHIEALQAMKSLAHRVADSTKAASLFASQSWYVPPPPPPIVTAAPESQEPAAPVAPPLPFSYMGSFTHSDGHAVYFLTRGDRVYDVRVGEVIDDSYSLDGVSNGQLLITYKPLDIQQQLFSGDGP